MSASPKWPLAIGGMLAVNVIASVALAVVANSGRTQIIPDYYARATHYDDELARSSVSQALGWRVTIALAGRNLELRVTDASGAPIDGARVRITGYQRAHAAELLDAELVATADGHYRAAFAGRAGRYDLVANVATRDASFTQHLVMDAP